MSDLFDATSAYYDTGTDFSAPTNDAVLENVLPTGSEQTGTDQSVGDSGGNTEDPNKTSWWKSAITSAAGSVNSMAKGGSGGGVLNRTQRPPNYGQVHTKSSIVPAAGQPAKTVSYNDMLTVWQKRMQGIAGSKA